LRQQTFSRMRDCRAALATDSAGRLWYAFGHAPLPDALRTLTHVLVLLSRNDLAFSAVLDQAALPVYLEAVRSVRICPKTGISPRPCKDPPKSSDRF